MKAHRKERLKVEVPSIDVKVLSECQQLGSRQKVDIGAFPIRNLKQDYDVILPNLEMSSRSTKDSVLSSDNIKKAKRRSVYSSNMTSFSEYSFPSIRVTNTCEKEELSSKAMATIGGIHPSSSFRSPPPTKAPHSSPVWHQPFPCSGHTEVASKTEPSENLHEHDESLCENLMHADYFEYDFACRKWKEIKKEGMMVLENEHKGTNEAPSRKAQETVGDDEENLGRTNEVTSLMAAFADGCGDLALHHKRRIDVLEQRRRHSCDADGVSKALTDTRLDSVPSAKGKISDDLADSFPNINNGSTTRVQRCTLSSSSIADKYRMNKRYLLVKPSIESERASFEDVVPDSNSALRERGNLEHLLFEHSALGSTSQELLRTSINPFKLTSSHNKCLRSNSTGSADFGSWQRASELGRSPSKSIVNRVQSFFSESRSYLRFQKSSQQGQSEVEKLQHSDSNICNLTGQKSIQSNPHKDVHLKGSQHIIRGGVAVNDSQQCSEDRKFFGNEQLYKREDKREKPDSLLGLRLKYFGQKMFARESNIVGKSSRGVTLNAPTQKSIRAPGRPPLHANSSFPRTSFESTSNLSEMKCGQLDTIFGDGTVEYSFWMDDSEQIFSKVQHEDSFNVGYFYSQTFTIFSLKGKEKRNKWTNWGQRKPASTLTTTMKFTTSIHHNDVNENGRYCLQSEFVVYNAQKQGNIVDSANLDPTLSSSLDKSGRESPSSYHRSMTGDSPLLPVSCDLANYRSVHESSESNASSTGINPWNSTESKLHKFSISRFSKRSSIEDQVPLKPSAELAAIVIKSPLEMKKEMFISGDKLHSSLTLDCNASVPTHRRAHSNFAAKLVHTATKEIQGLMYQRVHSPLAIAKESYNVLRRSGSTKESTLNRFNHTGGIRQDSLTDIAVESTLQWDKCVTSQSNSNLQQEFSGAEIAGSSVTIILPAGEHGCPEYGQSGPQPLIDRWKSGGKCDCGNWDLGCGLVVLNNRLEKDSPRRNQLAGNRDSGDYLAQEKPLEFFVQVCLLSYINEDKVVF
ncbi:hypothetical protein O6H91_05G046300 [Diphasiastrum complanatum]|uniref:Uncharacterized protein n=1 Tax=Diphasiastrum complanatum TaxID=34168 RepID=A0ACC2DMS6_DIPCM|nr:hypothetical protein O6H91_05G046300 [Diphasiastrum complanatum]